MKTQKLFLVSFLLLLLSAFASAQLGNTTTVLFPGVPVGGCTSLQLAQNTANGNLYNCFNGSWNLISGSGGSGVTGSGTAGTIPLWTGSTALGNSSVTDNGTTVATPEPINISGSGPGVLSLACTTPAPAIGSGIQLVGPTSCTPHNIAFPQTPQSGFLFGTATGSNIALSYQPFIDLTQNVGTTVLPVVNGGTGNATASGALINLFPNPTKVGDLIYWNGTAWNNFTGNQGAGATSFYTEAANGNPGWVQSPILVTNGGWGLVTLTTGCIYKGNGTGSPLCSALSDNGTLVTSSEPLVVSPGTFTTDVNPLNLSWTTNNAATTFSGMKFLATNAAFHSGSFNYQFCGGANCVTIDPNGAIVTPGSITAGGGSSIGGAIAIGGGTQPGITANSVSLSTLGTSSMVGYNLEFPAAAGSGVMNWTNASNQVSAAYLAVQGTDTSLLSSGTISASTGIPLCTDANHGATTTGCSGGAAPAITILAKSATYAPVAGDFSNGCTEWIEYSLAATGQTATLPSTAPTAGTCVVLKDITAPYYLQVLTGGATTLDGVAFASSPGFPVGAGASITIESDGTNYHTQNGNSVPQVLAANKGGFFSMTENPQPTASNQNLSSTTNQVIAGQFTTHGIYKISSVSFFLGVGLAAAVCDVGLYDSAGNKLFDINGGAGQACTTAQNGSQLKNTVSSVVIIPPGTYYAAGCVSATAPTTVTMGTIVTGSNSTQMLEAASTGTWGTAANACVAGVLPATLGTVTNAAVNGIPYLWMQP